MMMQAQVHTGTKQRGSFSRIPVPVYTTAD